MRGLLIVLIAGAVAFGAYKRQRTKKALAPRGNLPAASLYSAPGCSQCDKMRGWLEARGLEFVEYDVSKKPDALRNLSTICPSQRTLPVIEIAGRCLPPPFNESKFDDVLASLASGS